MERFPGYIVKQKKNNRRENYKEYLQYTTLQVREKGNVRKHVSAHLCKRNTGRINQ